MTTHELKIEADYMDRLLEGSKKAEVRVHDRDFQAGDRVIFQSGVTRTVSGYLHGSTRKTWKPDGITLTCKITHVLPHEVFPQGIKKGYCVLSVLPIEERSYGEVEAEPMKPESVAALRAANAILGDDEEDSE